MNRLLSLALVLMLGLGCRAQSQNTIKGRVLDAMSGESLPFSTIAVLAADSTVLTGAVADEDGRFNLEISTDEAFLSVSFIGYETQYLRASAQQSKPLEIRLKSAVETLDEVQVVAKAPIVEQQMDKLVMNVAQSTFAQGNNAMDLLRKAPGVSVDKDGNVKLNGQAVAVWIDGRPSYLDGKSLEALLNATDGTTIDKIEVISNPSAKYDAEGQGGIINIKTKHNFKQGFNGTMNVSGGGMGFHRELETLSKKNSMFGDEEFSLNLNYRTAKTNTFLQMSENLSQMGVDFTSTTDLAPQGYDFVQKSFSYTDADTKTANLKVGNDWFIDKKNTLGVIFTMPFEGMRQLADTNENRSYQNVNSVISQQIMTKAETTSNFVQYMSNVNFTHVFDENKASELTANLNYMRYRNNSFNLLDNYYLTPVPALTWIGDSVYKAERTSLKSRNIIDVYSAKADWQSVVFGAFMMEAGAKWALSKTDNEMIRSDRDLLLAAAPTETSTPFDYTEHIGALYTTLAGQLSPNIVVKLGLRGEYTYAYNSTNTVKQNYFNLFPTAYAGYNTTDMMKRYGVSYTRRIQRPNYSQLNPFQNYVDAHTSQMGNPDLKPSYTDIVSLNAGFGQYVTITGTYMKTHDVIGASPQINPTTGDQMVFYDNIGSFDFLGGSLTLSELPVGKRLTFMLSAQLYNYRSKTNTAFSPIVGTTGINQDYEVRSFYGNGYGCLTYTLPKDWKMQLDGFYSTPITQGYMHVGWNYMANLGVKKSVMDGRMLFSLNINDLFRTMNNDFSMMVDGVDVSYYSQVYYIQKVCLGFQWNFGTARKPLKQRNVGTLDEAERTTSKGFGN